MPPSTWGPRWTPTSTCSAPCIARLTISCPRGPGTPGAGYRRGGRHALCRAGDHGDPSRPAVPRGRRSSARPPVPAAAQRPGSTSAAAVSRSTIEWLIASFARQSPGFRTICCWSTRRRSSAPAPARRSSARRSACDALADAADYGYCASHSRFFWGFRLHALFAPDGTPRALALTSPKSTSARSACDCSRAANRNRARRSLIGDKGYAGRDFDADARRARRHDHAPPTQRRARQRPAPRPDPPAHRVDLLDLQGHPHPRTPRRPHPPQPPRPHRHPLRSHSPPPSRSTTNSAAPAAHSPTTSPNPWHYSSSGPGRLLTARRRRPVYRRHVDHI